MGGDNPTVLPIIGRVKKPKIGNFMDRYAMHARDRANELLELLTDEQKDMFVAWLGRDTTIDLKVITHEDPPDRILALLAQTPAKDEKWVQNTPRSQFLQEWLHVRYLALLSANALTIAVSVENAIRKSYRDTCRTTAKAVFDHEFHPETEDLIFLELDD